MQIKAYRENLPNSIGKDREKRFLGHLRRRAVRIDFSANLEDRIDQLNQALDTSFKEIKLQSQYLGIYGILPEKPLVSNPIGPAIYREEGCPNIKLEMGVIGNAIQDQESIYIPSVLDLENHDPTAHYDCREEGNCDIPKEKKRDMSEIVIVRPGTYKNQSAVQYVHDTDVLKVNIFSNRGIIAYEKIVRRALEKVFPNPEITYDPTPGMHIAKPFSTSKKRSSKKKSA